jgi:hypothetical protein
MEYNSFTGTSGGTEVTFSQGGMTTAPSFTGEFHAASGFEVEGDIMSTAKNPTGSPVVGREVRPSDTIMVHGQRMTVAMAQQFGFVATNASGQFLATVEGQAGASKVGATGGSIALASGGTAEEAVKSDFRGTPEAEEAMTALVTSVTGDTQLAAIDSFLKNEGQVDARVLSRMASQAGTEPEDVAALIAVAHEGMEKAVLSRLAPMGVYDQEAFAAFIHGSKDTHAQMVASVRDLLMYNSTKGFETLAEQFVEQADMVDPSNVDDALREAGIPFTRGKAGVVLDLTSIGHGQVPFRQAVRHGLIKLSRNR